MNSQKLSKIKQDIGDWAQNLEIVLYGSQVKNEDTDSSDIDLAVISRNSSLEENISLQKSLFQYSTDLYDIRVFELLPIHIQISIIQNYIVLFGDILEISEYFYPFRKKWDDVKHRILSNQFKDLQERIELRNHYEKVKMK